MKNLKITVLTAVATLFNLAAQPFFERVPFIGAFPTKTQGSGWYLDGVQIADLNSDDWTKNAAGKTTNLGTPNWTEWNPQNAVYPATTRVVSGDVASNTTWGNDAGTEVIEMSGTIHVLSGATLTIKPGTVIRGNLTNIGTLIVSNGAKIYAVGTPTKPIVFTSNRPVGSRTAGDWAGLMLMGKAQTNTGRRNFEAVPTDPLAQYGAANGAWDNTDNSGSLQFVRVEFAGYNYLPDQEINGITFGACGSGTRADFLQVSFSRDDSYEWFGGFNNHKYLIAYGGIDDDFDMDEGYSGKLQFLLGVRVATVFETSAGGTSHGFEHDNNTGLSTAAQNVPSTENPTPETRPVIANATMVGPRVNGAPQVNGQKFGRAAEIRTGGSTTCYNSIFTGYQQGWNMNTPVSTLAQGNSTQSKYLDSKGTFANNIFHSDPATYANMALSSPIYFQSSTNLTSDTYDATGRRGAGSTLLSSSATGWAGIFGNTTNSSAASAQFTSPIVSSADFTLVGGSAASLTTSLWANGSNNYYTALSNDTYAAGAAVPSFYSVASAIQLPAFLYDSKAVSPITVSQPLSFNVIANNITGTGFTFTSSNGFQLSTAAAGPWQTTWSNVTFAGVASFYVRYNGTISGTGIITLSANDARVSDVTINVSSNLVQPASPFINVSAGQIMFDSPSSEAPFISPSTMVTVKGDNLREPISVTAPSEFEVSSDNTSWSKLVTISSNNFGSAMGLVYIRANSISVSGVSQSIIFASTGANSVLVNVLEDNSSSIKIGNYNTAIAAEIQVNTTSISSSIVLPVKGENLLSDITIIAPAAGSGSVFQVSADNSAFGSTATLTRTNGTFSGFAYIRLNASSATAAATFGSRAVSLTATGVSKSFNVLGRVVTNVGTNIPVIDVLSTELFSNINNQIQVDKLEANVDGSGNIIPSDWKSITINGRNFVGAPNITINGFLAGASGKGALSFDISTNATPTPTFVTISDPNATVTGTTNNYATTPVNYNGTILNFGAANLTVNGSALVFDGVTPLLYTTASAPTAAAIPTTMLGFTYNLTPTLTTARPTINGIAITVNGANTRNVSGTSVSFGITNVTVDGSGIASSFDGITPITFTTSIDAIGLVPTTILGIAYNLTASNVVSVAGTPNTLLGFRVTPSIAGTLTGLRLTAPGVPLTVPGVVIPVNTATGLSQVVYFRYNGNIGAASGFTVSETPSGEFRMSSGQSGFNGVIIATNGYRNTKVSTDVTATATISAYKGKYSAISQSFKITGKRVLAPFTVNAPTNFVLSKDNGASWGTSVSISSTEVDKSVSQNILVNYSNPAAAVESGTISFGIPNVPSVAVSGNSVDFTRFIQLLTGGVSVLSVTSPNLATATPAKTVVTVSGKWLTDNLVITVPSPFTISTSATDAGSTSVTLVSAPAGIGFVSSTMLYVGVTSVTGTLTGVLTSSSTDATSSFVSMLVSNIPPIVITTGGINANVIEGTVSIYPNPTENGEVNIVAPANLAITVYNVSGIVVYSATTSEEKILVTGLNAGFYFIRIGTKSYKLIVR